MKPALLRLLAGAFFSLVSLLQTPVLAGTISRDLAVRLADRAPAHARGPEAPLDVVIQTAPGRGGGVVARLRAGGYPFRAFSRLNTVTAALAPAAIHSLARSEDVGLIAPDREVRGLLDRVSAAVGAGAAREATGLTGKGVGVAVLDTGVARDGDLRGRITGWADFVSGRPEPYDDSGHGTHVAGIIAGDGTAAARSGRDLRGIAPGARIIGVKVLDRDSRGRLSTVLAGIDWVLAEKERLGIRIVNLSLGLPARESYRDAPLCQAVERLWKAGIFVVVSAGNNGRLDPADPSRGAQYGSITSPGNHPLVLTVGAGRGQATPDPSDDGVATYSSRGPTLHDYVLKPDLVAPGNRVVSLLAQGGCSIFRSFPENLVEVGGARYLELSGTSMATPVAAGTAALMLEAEPELTPDTLKVRMMLSAGRPEGPAETVYAWGTGLLSVPGALASRASAVGHAFSPSVRVGDLPGTIHLAADSAPSELMIWGDASPWGDPSHAEVWALLLHWQAVGTGQPGAIMIWGDAVLYPD